MDASAASPPVSMDASPPWPDDAEADGKTSSSDRSMACGFALLLHVLKSLLNVEDGKGGIKSTMGSPPPELEPAASMCTAEAGASTLEAPASTAEAITP